jgi:hypothetical protein
VKAYAVRRSQPMVAGPSFSSEFPEPRSRVWSAQPRCARWETGAAESDQPRRKRQPACRLSGLQSSRPGKGRELATDGASSLGLGLVRRGGAL